MIERVCDQHKLIEHPLNFILKKKFILNGPSIYSEVNKSISLQFIVKSQTWYQNDRGVMLISNQSDAKIIGLGSRVIIGLNWP